MTQTINQTVIEEYADAACMAMAYQLFESEDYELYKPISECLVKLCKSGVKLSLDQMQYLFAYRMRKEADEWKHLFMGYEAGHNDLDVYQ